MPEKKKQRCLSPACVAPSKNVMNECYSPACRAKNKDRAHAYFYEENKEIVNGKVVKDAAIKSEYNGQLLHVDKRVNNTFEHYIAKPVSNTGLLERLSTDFNITKKHKHTHKKHKHKHNKHTHKKHKHKHMHKKHTHKKA